jgi:hypothetical protein
MLGGLASNGGPTQTRKLGAASPAIDAGSCPSLSSDQRGVPRPQGGACDIGAFETTPPSSAIGFPANSQLYGVASYGAGCGGPAPDVCGTALPNPDGANLNEVEARIARASDGKYWNGASWESGETWNNAIGTGSWSYGFLPESDTYTLSSRAIDNDGYIENTATVTFTVDAAPPAAPTLTSTAPASPANDNSPKLSGAAEAGSTVKLYSDGSCSTLAATGDAPTFASPGIGVVVPDNSTTSFHATATDPAGNTSACSASSAVYVEDSAAPAAPTLSSISPTSPANDNSPKLSGAAEAGSTVRLYTDGSCSTLAATGDAPTFASPGIGVIVPDNSTTSFHAAATDAAGNTSPCSESVVVYVEDSSAPVATIGRVRIIHDRQRVRIRFSSSEPGATFLCRMDRTPFAPCSSPEIYRQLDPGRHRFRLRAQDAAGNLGPVVVERFKIEPRPRSSRD